MDRNTISIKELLPLTNITRKQLNNRIQNIRGKYPDLIKGGGKGKGGRYSIHPFFTTYLIQPHWSRTFTPHQKNNTEKRISEFLKSKTPINYYELFKSIRWDRFCCYSPLKKIYDPIELINLIPLNDGDVSFYSIHRFHDESLHIHFTLLNDVLTHYKVPESRVDWLNVQIEKYDFNQSEGCFQYFTNTELLRDKNQKLVGYGFLMGVGCRGFVKTIPISGSGMFT